MPSTAPVIPTGIRFRHFLPHRGRFLAEVEKRAKSSLAIPELSGMRDALCAAGTYGIEPWLWWSKFPELAGAGAVALMAGLISGFILGVTIVGRVPLGERASVDWHWKRVNDYLAAMKKLPTREPYDLETRLCLKTGLVVFMP